LGLNVLLSATSEFGALYGGVTTGLKWYDTRARRGGGGAIDLAMHVLGLSFVDAVKHLTTAAAQNGPDRSKEASAAPVRGRRPLSRPDYSPIHSELLQDATASRKTFSLKGRNFRLE
jgi:hypothetical protein